MEYLLSKVDNINQPDSSGRTPLHYAAMKSGNTDVYKLLKSNGAIDNVQDSVRTSVWLRVSEWGQFMNKYK